MRDGLLALASGVILGGLVLTHELGCKTESCLVPAGEACTIDTACRGIDFVCADGRTAVRRLGPNDTARPTGLDALASEGDVLLENDRVKLVIDAIDHPHLIAPTGGSIIDFVPQDGRDDGLDSLFTATGLLPGDAARYTTLEIIDGDGFAAVQVRGHLDGNEDIVINTRYELRPCEPGVRVRTELLNLSPDAVAATLTDGWFWGGRSELAFTPTPGRGFVHPSFGLSDIQDVFEEVPYMAAAGHGNDAVGYGIVRCDRPLLEGFQSDQVSATGAKRRVVPSGDYEIYERFIAATAGPDIAPVVDQLLEVRGKMFGEPWAVVSGRVEIADGAFLGENEARRSVLIYEGEPGQSASERVPITQVLPDADGRFSARVPRGRRYSWMVTAFGRAVVDEGIGRVDEDIEIPPRTIPGAARVTLVVANEGAPTVAKVYFAPADAETKGNVTAKLLGAFDECAPLLGPPHGGSPACNRVVVREPVTVEVPPGLYDVYATRGPFSTLGKERVRLVAGEGRSIVFDLAPVPGLRPDGVLSADFHVHGGASFDSSIPQRDRVLSFLAADVDVIAATDHDVVGTYDRALEDLGVTDELVVMDGLETTGHVLFEYVPDDVFPRVVGHWNFWPLEHDPNDAYRGAPWDETVEPGALFDRVVGAGLPEHGVIQLNHPWGELNFGRDTGWPRAIDLKTNQSVLVSRDDTGPSLLLTTPPGATRSNADYDTQEVMNGTDNLDFLGHRAYWFHLLSQGIVRAGTANSDSHGLTDNVLGTPRTLVFTDVDKASFDEVRFNEAVKAGRMIGTNGPLILAAIRGTAGATISPSVESFAAPDGAELVVRVRSAPWVPVDQVRVVVNGEVVRIYAAPRDGVLRYDIRVDLADLLPDDGEDAWIVVEAGTPLADNADLDCDGVVDTGDNNKDGVIDWRDVDRNDDDVVDRRDLGEIDGAPAACDEDQDVGPYADPPVPTNPQDRGYDFHVVTPGGYPLAFTNPFLVDRDGDGRFRGGSR